MVPVHLLVCSACNKANDTTITTDIQAEMFAEPQLKSASVDVSTKDGMVTHSSQVPNEAARVAARNIASQSAGVKQVIDSTSIAPPTPPASPANAAVKNLPPPPGEPNRTFAVASDFQQFCDHFRS